MPSPSNPHLPSPPPEVARTGRAVAESAEPTAALFVRIPSEHARRLDRAAFELRVSKQSLVSELVERYVDPDSPASLVALGKGWGLRADRGTRGVTDEGSRGAASAAGADIADAGRRRVTVETLDQGELTVGRHSFGPRNLEVLTLEEAAELLQVDSEVVLELARVGTLPGRELGGEWRFARAALLEWLGAGSTDGTADVDAKG
jgi:excisionase family DNA binding protein